VNKKYPLLKRKKRGFALGVVNLSLLSHILSRKMELGFVLSVMKSRDVRNKMSYPTIGEYRKTIVRNRCDCGYEGLKELPFKHKEHEYGLPVAGFKTLVWLFVVCPGCHYAWALWKLQ